MKVTGTGSTSSTAPARRSERSDKRGGDFAHHLVRAADGPDEPQPVDMASPVAGVGALLAAQAVGDATDGETRRRMMRRGEDILDRLEELRHGLLVGAVPKDRLIGLAQLVRSRRDSVADPRLAALLDEIELRAEVELAKLSRQGG